MQTRPTRTIFFFLIFFQLLSTLVLVQGFDLRSYASGRIRIGLRQLLLAWRSNQDGVNTATGVGGTPIIEASRAYFTNAGDDRDTLTILCISIRGGAAADDSLSNSSHEEIPNSNQTKSIHSNTTATIANIDTATATKKKKKKRNNRIKRQKDKSFESPSTTATSTSTFNSTQITEKISIWKNETTTKAKRIFLDKIAIVSTALLRFEKDAMVQNVTNKIQKRKMLYDYLKEKHQEDSIDDEHENEEDDDDEITLQSDLLRPGRSFYVVTTAAIPWFTGTAVNPLLRAAYLCRITREINEKYEMEQLEQQQESKEVNGTALNITATPAPTSTYQPKPRVTLVIPWLELEEDRLELYGNQYNFSTPQEQETYIRKWLREDANMPIEADEKIGLQIIFYPSRYHSGLKSIFAMGDIASLISSEKDDDDNNSNISNNNTDVCVLEEPEHLNWYRAPGDGWTNKFEYVIGIIHTNYVEYASSHYSGLWTAPAIRLMSSAMVRAYCHVVIKLSDTLQTFAEEKERTSNIHGVRLEFIKEGMRRRQSSSTSNSTEITDATSSSMTDTSSSISSSSSSNKFDCRKETDFDNNPDQNNTMKVYGGGENSTSSQRKAYFIGKLLWTKGLDGMLEMQTYYKQCTGRYFEVDIYGSGPDEKAIKRAFLGRNQNRNIYKKSKDSIVMQAKNDHDEKPYNETLNDPIHDDFESKPDDEEEEKNKPFSHHVAKISKQIQATTRTFKSTSEALDLELPQSLHEYRRVPIPAKFPGRVDHAILKQYTIFVNPSVSEVLCTTTAEALAMGKFVIIPVHPSNSFFMQFSNCLAYRNKLEFAANLSWALSHDPEPLTDEQLRLFTWEAATGRLVEASAITRREAKERQKLGTSRLDERIARFHYEMGNGAKGDILRKVLGAGPASNQVKYELSKKQSINGTSDDKDDDGGLSMKFVSSSLADAIRKTFSNGMFVPVGTFS
mmetsp:Transcript_21563/g.24518  ORF Transcript_21563/g.24518 Transcript_21563/m.24518 type:complete len:961 (+) Transcript_21563:237-3119(+)